MSSKALFISAEIVMVSRVADGRNGSCTLLELDVS